MIKLNISRIIDFNIQLSRLNLWELFMADKLSNCAWRIFWALTASWEHITDFKWSMWVLLTKAWVFMKHRPELDIGVEGHIPELFGKALSIHGIVTKNIHDVFISSSKDVQATIFLWCHFQNLNRSLVRNKEDWAWSVCQKIIQKRLSNAHRPKWKTENTK